MHIWSYLWKSLKVELVSFWRQVVNPRVRFYIKANDVISVTRIVGFGHLQNYLRCKHDNVWNLLHYFLAHDDFVRCFKIKETWQAFLTKNTNLFSIIIIWLHWPFLELQNLLGTPSVHFSCHYILQITARISKMKLKITVWDKTTVFFSVVKIKFLFTHRGNWCQ